MIEELNNINSEKSDLRKFGITIGVILLIIAGCLYWKGKESFQMLIILGVVLCVFGIAKPVALKPIYWAWMIVATILGWIMTNLILSLLFYIVITPIGLIPQIFGKKFLELQMNKSKESYWNYRKIKQLNMEDYEKQF
jgi:hypothetical protein